ncbi:hypothetical protein MC885_017125 [Smutsia gigantea]|nr:hypothetical protein MC885_017125 [Smutsia gigantea]
MILQSRATSGSALGPLHSWAAQRPAAHGRPASRGGGLLSPYSRRATGCQPSCVPGHLGSARRAAWQWVLLPSLQTLPTRRWAQGPQKGNCGLCLTGPALPQGHPAPGLGKASPAQDHWGLAWPGRAAQ